MITDMKGNTALLILIAILLCVSLFLSYTNYQQIQVLSQENASLWVKIDSVQQLCSKKPIKQSATPVAKPASTGSAFLDFLIKIGEESKKEEAMEREKQSIVVSTKYRLEDRYVLSMVYKPEVIGNQTGEVVLNISVDYSGDVKSAKLQSATGITDEDVIEACKKAALKTDFNYNSDHHDNKAGTITYTFTAN